MPYTKMSISFLFTGLLFLFCVPVVFAQQNINQITVTVTFDGQPETYTVKKAPLKYNKTFAFSFQVDDGSVDIFSKVFSIFNNLKYTDGCGNDKVFTASSSVFCFFQPGENGPDMHDPLDPSYSDNYLTWENIKYLYERDYGIYNHGVNDNDETTAGFMNYSIKRNRSFIRRLMYGANEGRLVSGVFVTPSQKWEWTQPAWDNGYHIALNKEDNGPIGIEGGDVNNTAFNWTEKQYIKRQQAYTVIPVLDFVSGLLNKSVGGANYWGSLFTHNIADDEYPQGAFDSDFANIAASYGKGALDNILLASDEEIYDYLNVRDAVTLNESLNGDVLTITFAGSVPDNLRYYAMSLLVESETAISSITVDGSNSFSRNVSSGLINFEWDDQIVADPVDLAENYTLIAEQTNTQWDAWIAMDYVYTLPLGPKKVELSTRLCGLDGLNFDNGFCDITIDTVVKISGDSVLCLGDTTVLTATAGMDYYLWSDGQATQTIKINPTETMDYWVQGTLDGNISRDTVTIVVNPVPNIVSHSDPYISHMPGINDTLWVSTQDPSLLYLWNTGGEDSTLIVNPDYSTDYYVDVINEFECNTRQNFHVNVSKTFDFKFDSVCFGDTTHLINTSSYPDSVIVVNWDLDSDGVFDDAQGDTVNHKFIESGNHLVGMRSTLFDGGFEVVFQVVAVGDFPKIDFLTENTCLPGSTTFDDMSTVVVGDNVQWNWDFGDNGTSIGSYVSHTYYTPNTYNVKLVVTSNIGCKDSLIRSLQIFQAPEFNIVNSEGTVLNEWDTTRIDKNDSLFVTIENANSYDSVIWNNIVRNIEYYVTQEGTFSVDAYDGMCSTTRLGNMIFNNGGGEPTTNEIMNLFTPNGDGFNDNWVVNDPNISFPISVSIYNRYGNLVYSADGYDNNWQGTRNGVDLPQATYYYVITDAAGNIFKGPITILR